MKRELDREENEKKFLAELYVHSANRSTSKATWAYSLLIVVCVTAGMAFYNENFSFMKKFSQSVALVYDKEFREQEIARFDSRNKKDEADTAREIDSLCNTMQISFQDKSIHGILVESLLKKYVDTTFFSFPVIGIGISTSDIISVLAACIILTFLWSLICLKNENLVIGKILNRTQDYPLYLKKYILSGIGFENVFFPISYRNKPFARLETNEIKERIEYVTSQEKRYRSNILSSHRMLSSLLFILPLAVVAFGLVVTIRDISASKLFRAGIPADLFSKATGLSGYNDGINIVVGIMCVTMLVLICLYCKAIKYTRATGDILFDYKNTIKYESATASAFKLLESGQFKNRRYELKVEPVSKVKPSQDTFYLYSLYARPKDNLAHIVKSIEKYECPDRRLYDTFYDKFKQVDISGHRLRWRQWLCIQIKFEKESSGNPQGDNHC